MPTTMSGSSPVRVAPFLRLIQGKLGDHPAHDVADVGQPFPEVLVGYLGEQGRVLVEDFVERGAGVDLFLQDVRLDLNKRRVEQQSMAAEDGRLFFADLHDTRVTMASRSLPAA